MKRLGATPLEKTAAPTERVFRMAKISSGIRATVLRKEAGLVGIAIRNPLKTLMGGLAVYGAGSAAKGAYAEHQAKSSPEAGMIANGSVPVPPGVS